MKNVKLDITVPEEILLTLREQDYELALDMKRFTAVKLFADKKLSIGQCSVLAEMTKEDFIKYLGKNNVSIFELNNDSQLIEDLNNA